jgi:hypothetical protein
MVNEIEKPSRERRLLSGGLVALTAALALVASLLYAQPVIRAYWWIAAVAGLCAEAARPRLATSEFRSSRIAHH